MDHRSPCPVSTFLDILGDRWSLVIARDLLCGKSRFNEILDGPERIPPSILSQRLKAMSEAGLVMRKRYQDRPPRDAYTLTDKGMALRPVLVAMARWSETQVPGVWSLPDGFAQAG